MRTRAARVEKIRGLVERALQGCPTFARPHTRPAAGQHLNARLVADCRVKNEARLVANAKIGGGRTGVQKRAGQQPRYRESEAVHSRVIIVPAPGSVKSSSSSTC